MVDEEAWYILYSLVKALNNLVSIGTYHGDIQPLTSHISTMGELSLMNNLLMTNGITGLDKMRNNKEYKACLSPNLLLGLENNNVIEHDPVSSDIFSIAITALSVIGMHNFNEFYDWNKKLIQYKKIEHAFIRLKEMGFCEEITIVLGDMLEEAEDRRIKLQDLMKILESISIAPEKKEGYSFVNPPPFTIPPSQFKITSNFKFPAKSPSILIRGGNSSPKGSDSKNPDVEDSRTTPSRNSIRSMVSDQRPSFPPIASIKMGGDNKQHHFSKIQQDRVPDSLTLHNLQFGGFRDRGIRDSKVRIGMVGGRKFDKVSIFKNGK